MTAWEQLSEWTRALRLVHAARREQVRAKVEAKRRAALVRKMPIPELPR